MAQDPYAVLGLARTASADEIRSAYRKLAKKHHPDLNPGDAGATDRFRAIATANDILSDPDKRAKFDRGEIDAEGQPVPERRHYRDYAEAAEGARYAGGQGGAGQAGMWSDADLGDIFGDLFGQRAGRAGPMRGRDEHYTLAVPFLDAVNGGTKRLTLPDGRSLDVKVPAGIESGQVLRLRGKGAAGRQGAEAGDALIEIQVAPHEFYRREGKDIYVDLPVTLKEAILGGRITVPTPRGPVAMTVPPHAEAGQKLRLRGRGVASAREGADAGDLYAILRIVIGPVDTALENFLRDWHPSQPHDPRQTMLEKTA